MDRGPLPFLCLVLVVSAAGALAATRPEQDKDLSNAVRDSDVKKNKFSSRPDLHPEMAQEVYSILFQGDVSDGQNVCPNNVGLMWNAEVGSSIVATPLITDIFSDGKKEVVIPTFTHHLEALDGHSGEDVAGWPLSRPSLRTHASMIQTDIDHDGTIEFLVATYEGTLAFVDQRGEPIENRSIALPKLPILKDWADFSKREDRPEPVNRHIDGKEKIIVREGKQFFDQPEPKLHEDPLTLRQPDPPKPLPPHLQDNHNQPTQPQPQQPERKQPQYVPNPHEHNPAMQPQQQQQQQQVPQQQPQQQQQQQQAGGQQQQYQHQQHQQQKYHQQQQEAHRRMQQYGEEYDYGEDPEHPAHGVDDHWDGDNDYRNYYDDYEDAYGIGDEQALEEEMNVEIGTDAELSPEARMAMDLLYHPELYQSEAVKAAVDPLNLPAADAGVVRTSREILVDVHILAAPIVIDLDHDGNLDAVVPVSYYYDRADVEAGRTTVPDGVDPRNYCASGLVAVDLITGNVKWSKVMHTTTRTVSRPAYQLSSPILINVDEDAMLDIVVASPLGSLCVYDWRGVAKKGWPVHMAGFHAGPLVEDVDGDGKVDICGGDLHGNVACYNRIGVEIWETQVFGAISETPTVGDIDGDGFLDIVVGTASGTIYALDGRTGKVKSGFPIATHGPILSPVLLVSLNNSEDGFNGLHLIVPSHDGFVYIVSGTSLCMMKIDISENSYSMVVADDINSDGYLDLVITTTSGSVFAYETDTKFHPLKAWPQRTNSFNGLTAREGHVGVFISKEFRQARDVRGAFFNMGFTIEDRRPGKWRSFSPTYFVTITIGKRLIVATRLYHSPRTYVERIGTPLERLYATVYVMMMLPDGRFYEDNVAIGFNMHFMETIKWLLLIPFLLTSGALLLMKKEHQIAQPVNPRMARRPRPQIVTPYDDIEDTSSSDEDEEEFNEALREYIRLSQLHARQQQEQTRRPSGTEARTE